MTRKRGLRAGRVYKYTGGNRDECSLPPDGLCVLAGFTREFNRTRALVANLDGTPAGQVSINHLTAARMRRPRKHGTFRTIRR